MKKLLITGASGFLGRTLCLHARKEWAVYGTVFSHSLEIQECITVSADLTSIADCKRLFRDIEPEAVIHTAAEAQPDTCERNPVETNRINIDAAVHLAELCAETTVPFVFTSTDLVFDGEDPPYSEDNPISPLMRYGEQKAKAEERIRGIYPPAAICRVPLMYGDPSPSSGGSLLPILTALKEKRSINLFADQFRTPLCTNSAAKGLLHAINNFHGTIHLGGKDIVSRYEFGVKVADYCGLDTALLKPVLQKETNLQVPRPIDVSFDSSFAFSKGFAPLTIGDEFKRLACLNR